MLGLGRGGPPLSGCGGGEQSSYGPWGQLPIIVLAVVDVVHCCKGHGGGHGVGGVGVFGIRGAATKRQRRRRMLGRLFVFLFVKNY